MAARTLQTDLPGPTSNWSIFTSNYLGVQGNRKLATINTQIHFFKAILLMKRNAKLTMYVDTQTMQKSPRTKARIYAR
ncbi:hypothetical protein EYF80_035494 [Liparis tanakae]|uniref:Uncharacterized protein n=1 Tax=Liparis tanakae TaxID=230148 RepID=A0A4Z2GLA2_9TELE|nr:hypothetical protein EYF80_035494 [Liparis tanakae]